MKTMKSILMSAVAFSVLSVMPAAAQEGHINDVNAKRVGCYKQVTVPAKYSLKRVKIKDSYRQYIKRTNGRIDLMEYPAVYREDKTLVAPAHQVMREVKCN